MIILYFSVKGKKETLRVERAEDLLLALDKFVKKNKIETTEIKPRKLEFSPFPLDRKYLTGFTTERVAKSIFEALKLGLLY